MARSISDLADLLYSGRRAEAGAAAEAGHTTTVFGTASSDSEDGTVWVSLSDEVTQEDGSEDGTSVQLPTSVSVNEGDEVIVTLVGDTLKTPFVSGVVGEGDAVAGLARSASDAADAAMAVAGATGQHFWSDGEGAHVTELPRDEWEDAGGEGHRSGLNALWNSFGMVFRVALKNLMAITRSAVSFFDGNGNGDGNVVAVFGRDGSRIGRADDKNIEIASGAVRFRDGGDEIMSVVNDAETCGLRFLGYGYLRASKREDLVWLHSNDLMCLGTNDSGDPHKEQVQIGDAGITFKGSAGRDVHVSLGDGSPGSDGMVIADGPVRSGGYGQTGGIVELDAAARAAWRSALGLDGLIAFDTAITATRSIGAGECVEVSAPIPALSGYTPRGAVQAWASGSGNVIVGMPWRRSADNTMRAKVRANVASNVSVSFFVLYVRDM